MKLNLGCGPKHMAGYVNIDCQNLPGVDKVCDLSKGIPYPANSVDKIMANNFIEHVPDPVFLIKEMWQVCKNGAEVVIIVPHMLNTDSADPTHLNYFNEKYFTYFEAEKGNFPDAKFNVKITCICNPVAKALRLLPFMKAIVHPQTLVVSMKAVKEGKC